jgi:hypothetical protein
MRAKSIFWDKIRGLAWVPDLSKPCGDESCVSLATGAGVNIVLWGAFLACEPVQYSILGKLYAS